MATRNRFALEAQPETALDKPKTKRRGVTTDELILATAARLFAHHGFGAVSTKLLAAEAGVTIGAVYHYFPSKKAVYEAVAKRAFEHKASLPRGLVQSSEAAEVRLARMVAWFVGNIVSDRQFGMLLQRELLDPRSSTPDLLIKGHFQQAYELFRELLEELIPKADKDAAFAAMLALCFGFASLKGIYALAPKASSTLRTPDEIAKYATGLLLHGLQ